MPARKVLNELNELHHEFLALGTCVEELVAEAVRALQAPEVEGGTPVAIGGDALAGLGRRVADRCRRIVLLYQPVAVDFRDVTALLRMAAELEHIGNLAAEIVGRSAARAAMPVPVPEGLSRMAAVVAGMVRGVLDAYMLLDAGTVGAVARTGIEVNEFAVALAEWLTGEMRVDPAAVEPGLDLFAAIQNLQRIAAHAAALAEEVGLLTGASSPRQEHDYPNAGSREPFWAGFSV